MASINLGRRYERLLLASAPISLISMAVLFIAIASTSQAEHSYALCYENIANIFEDNKSRLESLWENSKHIPDDISLRNEYLHEVVQTMIDNPSCLAEYAQHEQSNKHIGTPSEIISKFRQDAVELNKTPLNYFGIEIPEKTTLNVFGTNIKISLMTITRIAQILLAPIIILWLGSLYNTRFRESRLIGLSQNIFDNFPHIINIYPSLGERNLLKRNWFLYQAPKIFSFFFACLRVSLLMVFIAPPIISYEWGLTLLAYDNHIILPTIAGVITGWFAIILLVLEFLPWHYNKIFHAASKEESRY